MKWQRDKSKKQGKRQRNEIYGCWCDADQKRVDSAEVSSWEWDIILA